MDSKNLYNQLYADINGRVNVMTRQSRSGQMIVIYDDHRWILNILYALYKQDIHPNLIYFDAHDDAAQCEKKSKLLEKIGVTDLKDATAKQFGAFVDYDERNDDGGWLTTAMELNLIGDVVNIGNRHNTNIGDMNGVYESEEHIPHNIFELSGDLYFELGCKGKLGDSCKEEEYKELRNFFGIEHAYYDSPNICFKQPYILDFDLDFFTLSIDNEPTHGWTERIMDKHFPSCSKERIFLQRLINKAFVITICREPDCCGSIGNSNRILEILDNYCFDGCLGTDVTL